MNVRMIAMSVGVGLATAGFAGWMERYVPSDEDAVLPAATFELKVREEAPTLPQTYPFQTLPASESVSPAGYATTSEVGQTYVLVSLPLGKGPHAWNLNLCTGSPK